MHKGIKKVLRDIFAGIGLVLVVQIFLKLLSANPAAPLVRFLYGIGDVLTAPVQYIFPVFRFGGSAFDTVALAALIFYGILFLVIIRVIRLLSGESHPTHDNRD